MNSQNIVEDGAVQGANLVNSTMINSTINIGKSDPSMDIVKILDQYANLVLEEKTNSKHEEHRANAEREHAERRAQAEQRAHEEQRAHAERAHAERAHAERAHGQIAGPGTQGRL